MGMFTEPILQLIAKNPQGLREVEIADKVDCDTELVLPSIREAIACREVLAEEVIAPNLRPAKAFFPTERLLARYPQAAKVVPAQPQPPKKPAETKSKAEMGVEFIKNADFDVVDDDLRRVMGLTKVQYPSAWLSGAVNNGLIHRDGKFWRAGKAPVTNPGPSIDVPVIRKSDGKPVELAATDQQETLPAEVVQELSIKGQQEAAGKSAEEFLGVDMDKISAKAVEQPEIPAFLKRDSANEQRQDKANFGKFTCALWSDGELQLARNGRVTETLTADEVQRLRTYLEKTTEVAA